MLFWKVMGYHPYEGEKIETNVEYMTPEEAKQMREEEARMWQERMDLNEKISEEAERPNIFDSLFFN